jgi:uncharacterized membrane protein YdfJ with MMPL/SSD domain
VFTAVITIALPVLLVYGLGVLVFEDGLLWGWKQTDGIYWLTPIMSFSILVGLGLDYDVFLFSRIYEYRLDGYSDVACITKGVYKTGGVITAAGVIMAIAFGGLLMSKMMMLNQFGFFLCLAVLIDTFIIRTMMVPALLRLAGPVNWWPSVMPEGGKDAYHPERDEVPCTTHVQHVHAFPQPTTRHRLTSQTKAGPADRKFLYRCVFQ